MKLITEEWVDKAEGDFATAQREIQVENMLTMMQSAFIVSNV